VLADFFLIGLWFRYTRGMAVMESASAAVVLYLVRLSVVAVVLTLACRRYRVSGASLGIRPSKALPDLLWSSRICLLCGSLVVAVSLVGLLGALCLGIRLPAPPALLIYTLGGHYPVLQFIAVATLGGAVAIVLAPLTEELVYRSAFLPALTSRIGLFPAIAVSSLVFGLAHIIAMGQLSIPVPEIIGGFLMAAGFSIRWSVIPALVIHAMGNLFAMTLLFIYVRLFKASPSWFVSP
jgi:membrane protease YdiL (CAAX protease family)